MRQHAPATERNRGPILDVLRRWLPSEGVVVEIGCGTGQHAAYLAPAFPDLDWAPTDIDMSARESTNAWCAGLPNVRPAVELDASAGTWPIESASAVFSANVIHISPVEVCEGLLAGAGRILEPGGVLVLYGPFRREGRHTAPSNEAFDESLRSRDPRWGIRDLETVIDAASGAGVQHETTIQMPANNLAVVFRRRNGVGA